MQFRVLGPIEIAAGDRVMRLSSDRRRRLLAVLLSHAGQTVSRDRLIEAVWGADPPGTAGASLQSHVSRLRRTLRDLQEGERIVTRGGGYVLVPAESDDIDAAAFDEEVQRSRALVDDDPAAALRMVEQALGRWRGSPYGEAADAVAEEVRRLEAVHASAREARVEALLALGRHEEIIGELEGRLELQPLDERAGGQLMTAQFASGRQADAVELYQSLRERLADELGVDPSPWLQQRYQDLLRQDREVLASSRDRGDQRPEEQPSPEQIQRLDGGVAFGGALPRRPTSFVGRDADVTAVAELVASEALVTLTGPGGVGKTRLAAAVAESLSERFDEQIVVELAPVRDPSSLDAAVAGACGVVPGAGGTRARLVEALRDRSLLLILDNCEHLLPEVATLVDHLIRRCRSLTVLATSRERLAVDGEHRWPVPPLDAPSDAETSLEPIAAAPAVTLFCDRARAADPAFALTEDNAAVVAEICRRLDGIPLALELAAARVTAFPVDALAARLDERFGLLTAGPRREGGPHRTLRDVVAWSYDLLDEGEARLFERLSVFAGGFTLAAAEEVAGVEPATAGMVATDLASLVDRSMVARSGSRYGLLETLRVYGSQQLAEHGEADTVRSAHARYYAGVAEEAGAAIAGPDEGPWADRLDRELDNLRTAHRWAVDVGDADLALRISGSLTYYGDWWLIDEIPRWAEEATALPGAAGHPLLPWAYGAAARGAGNRGELSRSVELARRGLEASSSADDPARLVPLRALSLVAFYDGRLDESLEQEAEILKLATANDRPYDATYVWIMRTLIWTYADELEEALTAADRAGARAERLGNRHLLALAAYCRGEALAAAGSDDALGWIEEALTTARELGVPLVEAIALVTRSSLRARQGDPAAALQSFRAAIVRLRRGGDWTHQWTTLRNLVFLLARIDAHEPATVLLGAIDATGTSARIYGEDAERLRSVKAQLRSSLGASRFTEAHDRGRHMTDAGAVEVALATIDELDG
ncbi:MAG: winged helix-turn-helix domain-containing protein [Actinomycetota bacterium]|nr:winged helix-turn-helix domain-containing protein [Actinomycetota bacterium]